MKKVALLLLILTSLNALAQKGNEIISGKNEIQLIVFRPLVGLKYTPYIQGPYFVFFNGIGYRRIFDKNAIRAGVDYYRRNYKSDYGSGDFRTTKSSRETRFQTGYQRMLIEKKAINSYFAIDGSLLSSNYQNEWSGGFFGSYLKEDLSYFGYGFEPTIGIKIKLMKRASLDIETSLELVWGEKKGTQIKQEMYSSSQEITLINTRQFVKRINPIQFSLNYTF